MKKTISMISEEFENEQTGEKVVVFSGEVSIRNLL